MTTTTLPLTNQAQAMLKEIQRHSGVLSAQVDAAVQQAAAQQTQQTPGTQATQGTVTALDCHVLEKVLLQAMPTQSQVIQRAKACGMKHHPDKTNGRFLTQILSMRIEKETAIAYAQPSAAPVRKDPLYATFTLAPNADCMLLFNARDVDDKGNPLLMKVARDAFDITKLDLTKYRTDKNGTQPDVVRIKDSASYVETKDIDETEFSFGDPLKQVSLDKSGDEVSTSVWVRPENIDRTTVFHAMRNAQGAIVPNPVQPLLSMNSQRTGDTLDTTGVKTFDERVRLSMSARSTLPAGVWLDDANVGAHVDVDLIVDRGLIFEPGSSASIALNGHASANLSVAVDKTDAHLNGNASTSMKASLTGSASLRQILVSSLQRSSRSTPTDQTSSNQRVVDVIYKDAQTRVVGNKTLSPLADVKVTQPELAAMKMSCTAKVLAADPQDNGAVVNLTLDDAFLSGSDFKGWKVVAGFRDENGTWQEQTRTVGSSSSKKEAFSFDVSDFDAQQKKNANVEIRLFNADGVPAQRVLVPFREVHWSV